MKPIFRFYQEVGPTVLHCTQGGHQGHLTDLADLVRSDRERVVSPELVLVVAFEESLQLNRFLISSVLLSHLTSYSAGAGMPRLGLKRN